MHYVPRWPYVGHRTSAGRTQYLRGPELQRGPCVGTQRNPYRSLSDQKHCLWKCGSSELEVLANLKMDASLLPSKQRLGYSQLRINCWFKSFACSECCMLSSGQHSVCSETSACKIQTPGNYPEESMRQNKRVFTASSLLSAVIQGRLDSRSC